jgi:hypothetical protein
VARFAAHGLSALVDIATNVRPGADPGLFSHPGSPSKLSIRENGAVPDDMEQVSDEADQAVLPTGKFRLYLGSAAGVGKTVAMLDEGVRRHERGHDIVIGFVETHNRPYTAEQIKDLEIVPRKTVEYRGSHFEEMDHQRSWIRSQRKALARCH